MDKNSENVSGPVQHIIESFVPITAYRFKWILNHFLKINMQEKILCPVPIDFSNKYVFEVSIKKVSDSDFCFYLTSQSNKKIHIECDLQVESQTGQVLYHDKSVFKFDTIITETPTGRNTGQNLPEARIDRICSSLSDTLIFDVSLKKLGYIMTELVYDPATESSKKLLEDMRGLCHSSETADVTLCVGEEKLFAHKLILCARSPVFKSMLANPMKEKGESIIKIDDVAHSDLKIFLHYLYTGVLPEGEMDAHAMYYIADKYQLVDLRKICGDILFSKLTASNAWWLLDLAHHHTDEDLKKKVLGFISHNASSVLPTYSWRSLISKTVRLAIDTLWYGTGEDNIARKRRRLQ